MELFIDADACPVTRICVEVCRSLGIPVTLVSDDSHFFDIEGTRIVNVCRGRDSADLYLVNLLHKGDAVITQDYGLAALCLSRNAHVMDQNGRIYTEDNINTLLAMRHLSAVERRKGTHIHSHTKRNAEQNQSFRNAVAVWLKELNIQSKE